MTVAAGSYITVCPVGCDAPLMESAIRLREGVLRRCGACGQLLSQVGENDYWLSMRQFDNHDFNQTSPREAERRFRLARRRLHTISALIEAPPSALRVLDVGCSRGDFLAAGERLGYWMEGVEPAATVAAIAQAAGLSVHTGLLEEVGYAPVSFDAVTLFEVIEHLKQPLPLLAECRRILKPGGVLLISTGNAESWTAQAMRERWDYFDIEKDGGHISFYNPRSIALLAARAGYVVQRVQTARVKFYEKGDVSRWRYTAAKLLAELLNLPARAAGRGHDMLVYLRKPAVADGKPTA